MNDRYIHPLEVEGLSPDRPATEDEWQGIVDELGEHWRARFEHLRGGHNQDGYLCQIAGSPACEALGHVAPEEGWWEDETGQHEMGWEEMLCLPTKYGSACTTCESDECDYPWPAPPDREKFWALFGERA
jgi:hypothetical protein